MTRSKVLRNGQWTEANIESKPIVPAELTQEQRDAVCAGMAHAMEWREQPVNELKLERLHASSNAIWEEQRRLGVGTLTMRQVLRIVENRKISWKHADQYVGVEDCDRSPEWALGFLISTGVIHCYRGIEADNYESN